jgi:hypothetical protein
MRTYPDVRFQLDNVEAATRLQVLIAWLTREVTVLEVNLARVPESKARPDALGRKVLTEDDRKRQDLTSQLEIARHDLETARCWLIECATPQTWQIGMEVARWLNRPALAQSEEG